MNVSTERPLALITGASAGIGATFARCLAARGCDLILVARRIERLEELAGELAKKHRVTCETLAADLATDEGIAVAEQKIASSPRLEYLINNAGFGTKGRFFRTDLEGQDRMHRLHVLATVRLTHAALRGMVERQRGNIVNVSSVAGFFLTAGSTSYCATKHWMNVFTEGIYLELKGIGSPVRVQSLCPGFTYSEFHDVAGMDRKLVPDKLWLAADFVVAESLKGLDRGQLLVVPDWRYRLTVFAARHMPLWMRHGLARRAERRMKKDV